MSRCRPDYRPVEATVAGNRKPSRHVHANDAPHGIVTRLITTVLVRSRCTAPSQASSRRRRVHGRNPGSVSASQGVSQCADVGKTSVYGAGEINDLKGSARHPPGRWKVAICQRCHQFGRCRSTQGTARPA
jgi:hypothetical protein